MSYSIMHGNCVHFQKPNLLIRGCGFCPADDRRTSGGRALCPLEAVVPRMELDPAKRPTKGHDLPGAPVGPGAKGRHQVASQKEDPFQKPFPAPKPPGKD